MAITHAYEGMGAQYANARKGTPEFARFMIENSGLAEIADSEPTRLIHIAEFGVGGGQQTEFVESELGNAGIDKYVLPAFEKSFNLGPEDEPGQLNVLKHRIEIGEISDRVIPIQYDIDGQELPIPSGTTDLSYMAFVQNHLTHKAEVLREIARITRQGGRHFIFGAVLEDLVDHPLNVFFPQKYGIDARRYSTSEQMQELFQQAGFSYEHPHTVKRDDEKRIDREFLESVENMSVNSVLKIIKEEDPDGFRQGVEKVREEVEKAEQSRHYRKSVILRTIHWGIKQ